MAKGDHFPREGPTPRVVEILVEGAVLPEGQVRNAARVPAGVHAVRHLSGGEDTGDSSSETARTYGRTLWCCEIG